MVFNMKNDQALKPVFWSDDEGVKLSFKKSEVTFSDDSLGIDIALSYKSYNSANFRNDQSSGAYIFWT